MTKGVNEVGDLRLGVDSRERYATRSRQNRAAERENRETMIFEGTHTTGGQTEIFIQGNIDEEKRFALEQVDGYSAAVVMKAQLRTADGARQATVQQLFHVQNVGGALDIVAGTKEQLGDADLVAVLVDNAEVLEVHIDDGNGTELAFDAVVQLEVLQQFG